ncbi:MAG: general secretion pathway protein J [Maricaulis maris]|jgi:general secretion pathway protein J
MNRDSGFTLFEALVAVALLALLAGLLAPAIRAVSLAETRVREHVVSRETTARLEALLRDSVARVQPLPDTIGLGAVSGSPRGLSLWVRMPTSGELVQLNLTIEGEDVIIAMAGSGSITGEPQTSMLAGVGRDARFYYYGETETRDALAWTSQWEYNHLPRLIVLDLAPINGTIRRIELDVPAQARFDCDFDSGFGVCLGGG